MTDKPRVPPGTAKKIQAKIPEYEEWFGRAREQGKQAGAGMYADALGRCHFYLGRDEVARRYMVEAAELYRVYLEKYRQEFQDALEKGRPHAAKPTELAYEIMACASPLWWIGDERANGYLQEAIALYQQGLSHPLGGVQFDSWYRGSFAWTLLGNYGKALEWVRGARKSIEEHRIPIEDRADVVGAVEEGIQALLGDTAEAIRPALGRLEVAMRRIRSLIYGINPSDNVLLYECLRRELARLEGQPV